MYWVAFKTGSEIFLEMFSGSLYSGILRLVTMLEKNVFVILAISLPLLLVLSFLSNLSFWLIKLPCPSPRVDDYNKYTSFKCCMFI